MRLILSRKGFDSSSGGTPSPIFPDGRILSLPIPDKGSSIRYSDIVWQGYNLGTIVSDLTRGKIPESYNTHLDPDLNQGSLKRSAFWRPIFGQTGIAQGHLRKNKVRQGDIFLFFGLFRPVIIRPDKIEWDRSLPPRHIIWGWLQIIEIIQADTADMTKYKWAQYHPHFRRKADRNNTVYVSRKDLYLAGREIKGVAGAGIFPYFYEKLQLTAKSAKKPSLWKLPEWFFPSNGKSPLTYHRNMARWQRSSNTVLLQTAARGQEFVLDCDEYPKAVEWLEWLLKS
jgi:hypothetical protein